MHINQSNESSRKVVYWLDIFLLKIESIIGMFCPESQKLNESNVSV